MCRRNGLVCVVWNLLSRVVLVIGVIFNRNCDRLVRVRPNLLPIELGPDLMLCSIEVDAPRKNLLVFGPSYV